MWSVALSKTGVDVPSRTAVVEPPLSDSCYR